MDQPVEGVPLDGVAARTDRVAQGVVGVALLAAFVFRIPWIVPVLALLLAVAALAGPKADAIHIVFERWIAPRLPAPRGASLDTTAEEKVPFPTVRAQDGLAAGLLLVASFAFPIGIALVGWILVLIVAVAAIVAATTRIHVADRFRRHR
ncbi:MAG: hypothetical protein JWM72_1301 [Actinomycetia bacterium]|nr:hypothetical protein [Actinomycetes bacterium]